MLMLFYKVLEVGPPPTPPTIVFIVSRGIVAVQIKKINDNFYLVL